jgi:hypothetical protein
MTTIRVTEEEIVHYEQVRIQKELSRSETQLALQQLERDLLEAFWKLEHENKTNKCH